MGSQGVEASHERSGVIQNPLPMAGGQDASSLEALMLSLATAIWTSVSGGQPCGARVPVSASGSQC